MTRRIVLHMLVLFALLYTSCKKEDSVALQKAELPPSGTGSSLKFGDQTTGTTIIDNPASFKGMYVDNADAIIGNATSENNLINYAVSNGINAFELYGLKNLIKSSANYAKVRSFLSKCSQNGITHRVNVIVYYPGSINSSDSTYVRKYNSSCTSSSQKITGINMEWEWWNSATTWATYDLTLKSYYNWTRTVSPQLTNEVYFGWFKNPIGIEMTQATDLVKYCDRILLHDYRTAPDVAYMKSRMDYLGQAALNQGSPEKIIVLFSAESSFMGPYYSSHTYDDAYQSIASQYSSVSFSGKSGVRIYGWAVFKYSKAKLYRP